MQLTVVSYGGTSLSDSSFTGYFPSGSYPFTMEQTRVLTIPRHRTGPAAVDIERRGHEFTLYVKMLGTTHSQLQTLKALFDTTDARTNATTGTIMKRLIVKDTADSNKQWYIDCRATSYTDLRAKKLFVVTLFTEQSNWYEASQSSDSWGITASGQTHDVTTAGTLRTPPILEITPTSSKSGGLLYQRFVRVYNPIATPFLNEGLELTGSGLDTTALVSDTTVSNTINDGDGITDADTTIDIDGAVGGGLPAAGMGYVGTEQISWTANSGTQLTGVTRGIGGTTAATHADNAVITLSHVLANGDDLQVLVDGLSVDRWFGTGSNAFNQAATLIYITNDWHAGINLTIAAATDAATSITFQDTRANKTAFAKLPTVGMARLESEIITWTSKDAATLAINNVTRGTRFSSAAAHSAGVTFYWIEHDVLIGYGDYTAPTPTTDNTHKPMFALTSTNTSRVYNSAGFATAGRQRANEWQPSVETSRAPLAVRESQWYETDYSTASGATYADPATEMGMRVASWLSGTRWTAELAGIVWLYYDPAGVTTVTATGEKYRTTTAWAKRPTFEKSATGRKWTIVWTEATPASTSVWASWSSHSSVSLSGTFSWLRFLLVAAVAAGDGNEVDTECDAITLTRDSSNVIQVSLGAEQGGYDLNCKITNNDTGDYITVRFQMVVNQTLQIDCEKKQATYLKDNSNAFSAITGWSSKRQDWLDLLGNTANTLQFDDTGTVGVTLVTKWRDREL